jgi:hypothetical protein
MMPTMTRRLFRAMSFEELVEWAYENISDVHTEGGLIGMAKHEIDEENLGMALHILNAVYDSEAPDDSYYLYDRSMGILETPTPITCKEDLEDYIDFEEDEGEELIMRETTCKVLEMMNDGLLDPKDLVMMCFKWMSEDDVKEMCKANEIDLEEGEEDEED